MSDSIAKDKELLVSAADVFAQLGLSEIRIKNSDTEIYLKREPSVATQSKVSLSNIEIPSSDYSATSVTEHKDLNCPQENPSCNEHNVTSPLLGVFYLCPQPDAEPFVKIGTHVKRGDTLCIVEAMKMMNEISADTDGVISKIAVNNGDLVQFGQVLFNITPDK